MIALLLACAGQPDDTQAPQDSTPAVDTQDTQAADDTAPPVGRDLILVTELSSSLADDHAHAKSQAEAVLALLGPGDRLGVVTDGADGCATSGVLNADSDPQAFKNAFNGQEGPLSGNLLEATERALGQTQGGCNVGLGREGATRVVVLLSDQSGQQHDLVGIAEYQPVIWWLGEGGCTGPYADAVSTTGGQVLCPWMPDGLTTALAE